MDVIVFEVFEQSLALKTLHVLEVLEPLPVTFLPFAPNFVEGLVNVSGQVFPQIDLGLRLGIQAPLQRSQGFLLLIEAGAERYVLRIDRVLSRLQIDESDLMSPECSFDALNAVVEAQFSSDDRSVLLLNPENMGLSDIVPVDGSMGGEALLALGGLLERRLPEKRQAFLIAPWESVHYALALDEVSEVLEWTRLQPLPHAPETVLGMMSHRGLPVPVLALNRLLHGPKDSASYGFVIVIEHESKPLGLAVEQLPHIRQLPLSAMHPVERLEKQIKAYCLSAESDDLIYILSLERLLDFEQLAAYRGLGRVAAERLSVLKKRLLIVRLGSEFLGLQLEAVSCVEEDSTWMPVPLQGDSTFGVMQVRGEVVPAIDLSLQLGLKPSSKGAFFVVVEALGGRWALNVDGVERVIEIQDADLEAVASSGAIAAVGQWKGRLYSVLCLESLLAF